MIGPTLRIGQCGPNVSKKASYFAPVKLEIVGVNDHCTAFLNARTVEDQLACMKEILQDEVYMCSDVVDFLARVFLEAPPKHPVKCSLARHVTKNAALHTPFANSLSKLLLKISTNMYTDYNKYVTELTQLLSCVENFPAGVEAFKTVEVELAVYLIRCAKTCLRSLNPEYTDLSVTEKNEVLDLAHLTLRLLLYIVQKLNQTEENSTKLNSMLIDIMLIIKELLVDEDLPMDAKSVAGILLLTLYVKQNAADSWLNVICENKIDKDLNELMENPFIRMSMYSAVVSVVPVQEIQNHEIMYEEQECNAVIALARRLIGMTNKYATVAVIVLGIARTMLQVSKMLDKLNLNVGKSLFRPLWDYIKEYLDHHMDSVQHLTSQALDNLVLFAIKQNDNGNPSVLNHLITDTQSMLRVTKAPYVSLTSLVKQIGAKGMFQTFPGLIEQLLVGLHAQATQASVTTLLETLLKKHCHETSAEAIDSAWIGAVIAHVDSTTCDTSVMNILENLIAKAVGMLPGLMDILLVRIKKPGNYNGDTSSVMTLLNGLRKAGGVTATGEADGCWKGLVQYEFLERSAVELNEKVRHLSLSLIVESPKTTESFTKEELQFVLYYLKYNINAQSPHFRQLTLSLLKKFMKRLMTSYAVLKRQTTPNCEGSKGQFYLDFVDNLREFCFDALFQGANYSRRCVALQLLVWCEHFKLDGYQSVWKEDHVERMLFILEDTYEANKQFALEILDGCPQELLQLKIYSITLDIREIFKQASLLKPTECVSASYKLVLVKRKLPETILELRCNSVTSFYQDSNHNGYSTNIPEIETYILIQRLLDIFACQFNNWNKGLGAATSPVYGVIRCVRALLADVDYNLISHSEDWKLFIDTLINMCFSATNLVSSVVNDASPEGYLPMDFTECNTSVDTTVTAQMVLLSAWRTVKECSLLLGEIFSKCSENNKDNPNGALSLNHFYNASRFFVDLLEQTQHRGAFEHAYIGFTMLIRRMWSSKWEKLSKEPNKLLSRLLLRLEGFNVESAEPTRRSAGLPLIVQAILTTELEFEMSVPHIQNVLRDLIATAERDSDVTSRVHAMNVLRSLFRCSPLEGAAGAAAAGAVALALKRFDSRAWAERNSATLLFSALMVRMFGVQRERERLGARNRMTARIFFLKYPALHHTLLEHLRACVNDDVAALRPSLFPVLLILSRLYPSSLEGTACNHKLSCFVPLLEHCARAANSRVRRSGARAYSALCLPRMLIQNIHKLLDILGDSKIKRNHCHGVLLQLIELLSDSPKERFPNMDAMQKNGYNKKLQKTHWILRQLIEEKPCYLIADEYFKVLFLLAERIPGNDVEEMLRKWLEALLTSQPTSEIYAGRLICLSNAVHNYLTVYQEFNTTKKHVDLIEMCLGHTEYEIVLAALNYLSESYEKKIEFTRELNSMPTYIQSLKHAFVESKYPQCVNLSLELLVREMNASWIVSTVTGEEKLDMETVFAKLIDLVRNDDKSQIYLRCLFNSLGDVKTNMLKGLLEIAKVMFEYSTAENEVETRRLVAECLETHGKLLIGAAVKDGSDYDEYRLTLWATFIVLLLDEEVEIRDIVCRAFRNLFDSNKPPLSVSLKTMESLLPMILSYSHEYNIVALTVVALLDFKSEVYMNDGDSEKGRVFDQNERHNIFGEEMLVTTWAAGQIWKLCINCNDVMFCISQPKYSEIVKKLCNDHVVQFKDLVLQRLGGNSIEKNANPKVKAFFMQLYRQ